MVLSPERVLRAKDEGANVMREWDPLGSSASVRCADPDAGSLRGVTVGAIGIEQGRARSTRHAAPARRRSSSSLRVGSACG